MMRLRRIQTNALLLIITAFIISAIFIAAKSDKSSEEINEGFQKLEGVIARQDSILHRQSALIETQTGKILELELTIETLQKSNEDYKHKLDSVSSIINYMQHNYIHKRVLYERISPGGQQ